ncbi:MAG: alginate export family protein [Phycisphaerae bacterium]
MSHATPVGSLARRWTVIIFLLAAQRLSAQATQPASVRDADRRSVPASQPAPAATDRPRPDERGYFVLPPAYGTRVENEPPRYVRTLGRTGIPALAELDWLDFGADHRTRFEFRDDDYRRPEAVRDTPFQLRSRGYLGVHDLLDPFRFGFEFTDARWFNSGFPADNNEANANEILQLFGELFFKDAVGPDRPLRLQAGRFSFDFIDRRLINRNNWRNTTNSFDGFRAFLGRQANDWELDVFALQPVERRIHRPDRANEEEWFYGLAWHWRRWSRIITLQPYYLVRDQDHKDPARADREIHTFGLHGYGYVGQTGLDYDFDVAWQCGKDGRREQRALAAAAEAGYTLEHEWKPRVSANISYASGDRDPADGVNERFDRLYGFSRPLSTSRYVIWENLIAPKVRMEFHPHPQVIAEVAYGAYWLAEDSDSWASARRRDPNGESGECIGQEIDTRLAWTPDPRVTVTVGYAHFMPGSFTRRTGPADDSDFFYVETVLQLFK